MAVLSAEKKMNLKTLKKILNTKNIKIPDAAEALKVTVRILFNLKFISIA